MKATTFRIRRRIIQAFLFCVLAIVIFAGLSFQAHREMGRHLKLVERADDLVNNILEIRRFEKNFFLYQKPGSLQEARSYIKRVEEICCSRTDDFLKEQKGLQYVEFEKTLKEYWLSFDQIDNILQKESGQPEQAALAALGANLRNLGQQLLGLAEHWAREERQAIDQLFLRALYLFMFSILLFVVLGVLVALYISRLLVGPLLQMQHYMEKIAHGDFAPIPVSEIRSEEFSSLFRAFNRMTKELEYHQEQLLQSGKIAAIGTLTAGIAHELNNPINNIMLTAEFIKEDLSQLHDKEGEEMIQDILVQAQRASEIVRNLLDFSRAEQPEREPLDIAQVIRDTIKLVQNQLTLSGVEIEWRLPDSLPIINGDPKALQQVFLNLFINAIQAMKEGGILTIRAHPGSGENGHELRVDVADTGSGIEAEDVQHVFEPFFTTKEVGRGTGLGLSVSYGIVQKHGGHIEVKSKKGVGSTFTVVLPVEEDS
jgi:two-component system, NtrC family, sensor kinase